MQDEFAPLERVAQIASRLCLRAHADSFLPEKLIVVSPAVFRLIHGRIGVLEKSFGRVSVFRVGQIADARRNVQLHPSIWCGSLNAASIFSAAIAASCGWATSQQYGETIATLIYYWSEWRMQARRRVATDCSKRSPVACPDESFTCLKRSMSR